MMSENRFVAEQVDVVNEDETEVWDIVFDTENTYAFMVRDTDTASDLCDLLNEQQATIITLKRRLEKINGGYGHLTHRNGLTANEWLIESQEKELKKKNEQISDWIEQHSKDIAKICEQQATIKSKDKQLERLYNYFQDYLKDEMSGNAFSEMWDFVKEDEKWNDE